jgi:hypothetical protein
MMTTRRAFLGSSLRAGLALPVVQGLPRLPESEPIETPVPLAARFPDLRSRFIFEYYPWYGPNRHWNQWDRVPPVDIASAYVPRLGAYDSRAASVIEQHARWMVEAGAGAVSVSWWGQGSYQDQIVPLLLDVLRDHGLRATFQLEPYTEAHGRRFAEDVLYLVREYGEKRGFDAFLLLGGPGGAETPVFKGFRSILPAASTDCHGVTAPIPDYFSDDEWRRELATLRSTLVHDFPEALFLADTVNMPRAKAAGFDGVAVFDNFVPPESYALHATEASALDLLFSFNANPGFDGISPRRLEAGSCYSAPPFAPPADPPLDWSRADERERAARLSRLRIEESFDATVAVQTDAALSNVRRGFFLVYLNSFNEWHEGSAFEPMLDADALSPAQRAFDYHNPAGGDYRLRALAARIRAVTKPVNYSPTPGTTP